MNRPNKRDRTLNSANWHIALLAAFSQFGLISCIPLRLSGQWLIRRRFGGCRRSCCGPSPLSPQVPAMALRGMVHVVVPTATVCLRRGKAMFFCLRGTGAHAYGDEQYGSDGKSESRFNQSAALSEAPFHCLATGVPYPGVGMDASSSYTALPSRGRGGAGVILRQSSVCRRNRSSISV